MQTIGYIIDWRTKKKILILVRHSPISVFNKTGVAKTFKLRKYGNDGNHYIDEEVFLNNNYELLDDLLLGNVVNL